MNFRKPAVQSLLGFRVSLFVACAFILGGIAYLLSTAPRWPAVPAIVALGCVCLLCLAGMCFAALWNFPTQDEAYAALMQDAPVCSADALICRSTTVFIKAQVVILDEPQKVIHFGNCHTPRRFLAWGEKWRSCSLDEVVAAHPFRHKGHESLTIVTKAGAALIPDSMENYSPLKDRLHRLLPPWHAGFSTDHPMMGMIYVGAALVGLFVGVCLAPRQARDQALVFWAIVGASGGVAAARLAVSSADRYLGISIVPALGLAGAGALLGGILTSLLDLNWDVGVVLPMVGIIAGFVAGIIKQRRH